MIGDTIHDNIALAILTWARSADGDWVLADENGRMSGRWFVDLVTSRAAQLSAHGIGPGVSVLIAPGRGLTFWTDMTAAWTIGAVAVPFNTENPAEYQTAMAEIVRPGALLIGAERGNAAALDPSVKVLRAPDDGANRPRPIPLPVDAMEPAAYLFTSGSTGVPKGVVLSHHALSYNSRALLYMLPFNARDHLFVATPYVFTSTINHFLATSNSRARATMFERRLFKADLHRAIKAAGATCLGGAPLQIRWFAEQSAQDLVPLRWAMSSGDHLSVDTIALCRKNVPDMKIATVYGLTELGGRFCCLPPDRLDENHGAVGWPISGMRFMVCDENDRSVLPGTVGEINADGPCFFSGYLRNEEATRRVLGPHGLRTGDLGWIDEMGALHLTGRVDDYFKVSGVKTSALEIADAIVKTGLVEDVAVVPAHHAAAGSVPLAAYVPKDGTQVDESAIGAALRRTLAANQIPRLYVRVQQIPRTGSGKIDRRRLHAMLSEIRGES